jgi:hypothetical protein
MKALVLSMSLFAALAIGCGAKSSPASDQPAPPDQPAPAQPAATGPADSCTTAADCALVEECCGCNAGGKKIAIRMDAVASFESSRAERCGDVMCAQMISTDPSCDAEAICGSSSRCEVAPHTQHP